MSKPRKAELVEQLNPDGSRTVLRKADRKNKIPPPPPPPEYWPEPAKVDHWSLTRDLRVARRDAHFLALQFRLNNAGLEAKCMSDPIVPLTDLICAAGDVGRAAEAQWGMDYEAFVAEITGGEPVYRTGLAEYAARKSQRDLWREQLYARTGPLEPGPRQSVESLDDADLWQLLQQVDYALDCFRDAGGKA